MAGSLAALMAAATGGQAPAMTPAARAFAAGRTTSPMPLAPRVTMPVRLPVTHSWHPVPPTAFVIPKEPAQKSSRANKLTLPKLSTSLGRRKLV